MNKNDFIIFYERFAKEKLAQQFNVDEQEIEHLSVANPTAPQDLAFNGKTYNVKMANPTTIKRGKKCKIWDFDIRGNGYKNGKNFKLKTPLICDYWLLLCFMSGVPKKIYLIPNSDLGILRLRIPVSGQTKYEKYLMARYDKAALVLG